MILATHGVRKFYTLYNGSGQILRAARINASDVTDFGTFQWVCETVEEAAFLTSVLNAPCLQSAFQQSRKSDRDFQQHFWRTVPIPRFDPENADHRALVQLCEEAEAIAVATKSLHDTSIGQQKLSSSIRRALTDQGIAEHIDDIVRKIIPHQSEPAYTAGCHPWGSD